MTTSLHDRILMLLSRARATEQHICSRLNVPSVTHSLKLCQMQGWVQSYGIDEWELTRAGQERVCSL